MPDFDLIFAPQAVAPPPAPDWLHDAVQWKESRGVSTAVSPAGAMGLMQTMPATLLDPGYGVKPFDPKAPDKSAEMARVGHDYLNALYAKYGGDETKALVAYNWGPGNADRWIAKGADPNKLPAETKGYLAEILRQPPPQPQTWTTVAPKGKEPFTIPPPDNTVGGASAMALPGGASTDTMGMTAFDQMFAPTTNYDTVFAPAPTQQSFDATFAPVPGQAESYDKLFAPAGTSWSDTASEALSNLPQSIVKAAEGIAPPAVTQALSLASKVLPEDAKKAVQPYVHPDIGQSLAQHPIQTTEAIIKHYKGYLSEEGIKKAIAKDPAGTALDLFGLATGIFGAARMGMARAGATAGEVAGVADAGTAAKVAEAAPAATEAPRVAEVAAATEGAPKVETVIGPAAGATTDKAGNINLDRIYAPEDVKQVIRDTAARNTTTGNPADAFMTARRGVISQEQSHAMGQLLGMTPEDVIKRKIGTAWNDAEIDAAREIMIAQATKVREAGEAAWASGSDLDKVRAAEQLTRYAAIQEQVTGLASEAGRALNIFKRLAGASKEDIARLAEMSKNGNIDEIINRIHAMGNQPIENIANFAANAFKAKTPDMLMEAWINGLLSGPQTHATNILSNTLVTLWSLPEHVVAAGISKFTGSGIHFREVLARAYGMYEGMQDGIVAAGQAFRSEQPTGINAAKGELADVRPGSIPSKTFRKGVPNKTVTVRGKEIPIPFTGELKLGGKQIRVPGRLLMAEDEIFKSIAYRGEIATQAKRIGLNEGLSGKALAQRMTELKASPTAEMKAAAHAWAEKATFTTPLGPFGKTIMAAARHFPPLKIVLPFIRTPADIFKYNVAERSIFAPLFKETRAVLKGEKGAVERDQMIARIALGSAASSTALYLAMKGIVTGAGPVDPAQRALWLKTHQPYSIDLGPMGKYSYGRIEPVATLFGVVADYVQLSGDLSESERKNLAALIVSATVKNVLDKTSLRGMSEAIQASHDPGRYGAQYIQNLAGTLVPTGVAQVARVRDPYLRDVRSLVDKLMERTPFLREKLPVRRDAFGDPIKLEGSLGPDILSPIYHQSAKNDPLAEEMIRLKVAPGKLPREIEGVELTPQQYDAYQIIAGKATRLLNQTWLDNPVWKSMSDELRKKNLEAATDKARDVARDAMKLKFPALEQSINEKKLSTGTKLYTPRAIGQ